jgi:histone H3/H4
MPRDVYKKETSNTLPQAQVIRVCRKAGIKQQQDQVIKYIAETAVPEILNQLLEDSVVLADYCDKKTVQRKHIQQAIKLRHNRHVY